MPNQEEPKALKAIFIAGPDLTVPNGIRTIFDNRKDDCLIIGGDRTSEVTAKKIESTLKQKNFKITENTRIDINAHGCLTNDGQHKICINNPNQKMTLTGQFLQELKDIAGCPLYVHVWSCYGGSANKEAKRLGKKSILVTHVEGKSYSYKALSIYSKILSLKRYLEGDLTPYQQFILDFSENFATTTFNEVGEDSTPKKFKSNYIRMTKEKEVADILENLSSQEDLDLTDYFNDFFAKEGARFQDTFKDVDVANAINSVNRLNKQIIKTFATGVLIHLCATTTDKQFTSYLDQLVDTLLHQGINNSVNSTTSLHLACYKGNINVVKMLLAKGANPNIKNVNGKTPLHTACKEGHSVVVKMLLENDTDINAKDANNYTFLYAAFQKILSYFVEFFQTKKVDINAKSNDGSTPLHLACLKGHIEVIKELLKIPAIADSLTMKNNKGKTPLELITEDNKEAIALLTEAEKSMHSKDNNLALDNAEEINDLSVNQQILKDNSEQVSNNELQNDLNLPELPLVGHTEGTFSECYGA